MIAKFNTFKEKHPFTTLLAIAIAIRIVVIICVGGYGSNASPDQSVTAHLTNFLRRWITGITNCPKCEMFISRLLYSAVSLITVSLFYRIVDLLSNKHNAFTIALVPAFCCIMPTFGVINNVDVFLSIIFILYGGLLILRQETLRKAQFNENLHRSSFAVAGFAFGLAFFLWTNSIFFLISLILILFGRNNPKSGLVTLAGAVTAIVLMGVLNYLITGTFNFIV